MLAVFFCDSWTESLAVSSLCFSGTRLVQDSKLEAGQQDTVSNAGYSQCLKASQILTRRNIWLFVHLIEVCSMNSRRA